LIPIDTVVFPPWFSVADGIIKLNVSSTWPVMGALVGGLVAPGPPEVPWPQPAMVTNAPNKTAAKMFFISSLLSGCA
jgi:hypothetical protein